MEPYCDGDSIMINALSQCWGIPITVLTPDEGAQVWKELKFRHVRPLDKVDIVLIYNGHNHYSAAGTKVHLVITNVYLCNTNVLVLITNVFCSAMRCQWQVPVLQTAHPLQWLHPERCEHGSGSRHDLHCSTSTEGIHPWRETSSSSLLKYNLIYISLSLNFFNDILLSDSLLDVYFISGTGREEGQEGEGEGHSCCCCWAFFFSGSLTCTSWGGDGHWGGHHPPPTTTRVQPRDFDCLPGDQEVPGGNLQNVCQGAGKWHFRKI